MKPDGKKSGLRRATRRLTPIQRYLVALVSVGISTLLRVQLGRILGAKSDPFIVFFPAVMITGWYGGFGPGMLATLLSASAALTFYAELGLPQLPLSSLAPHLFLFVLIGAFISIVNEAWHRARDREAREHDFLELTLSSIADAVIATDRAGKVTFLNGVAASLAGTTASEAIGKQLTDVLQILNAQNLRPIESSEALTLLQHPPALAGGLFIRRHGVPIPVEESAAPIKTEDGEVVGFILVLRDVTEVRLAQDALKASNKRLSDTLNSISDAFVNLDREWRYTFVNKRAAELAGMNSGDILGKVIWDLFPEMTRTAAYDELHRAVERQATAHFEAPYTDGRTWFEVHAYPHEAGVAVYFQNVTRRRMTQETLKQLAAIVESSEDAIFSQTLDGRIVSWNRGAERVFGYSADEVQNKAIADLLPTEPAEEISNILEKLRRGESIDHYETVSVRADRTRIFVSVTISPLRDESGQITGASAIARDITARMSAELALVESEERYRRIIETANEGIWMVDKRGFTTFVNTRMAAMLSCTPEEIRQRPAIDFVFEEDREFATTKIAQHMNGSREQYDFRFQRKDGSLVDVLCCAGPVATPSGEVVGVLGMFSDITERKGAEEERNRLIELEKTARLEAEQAQRLSAELLIREKAARVEAEDASRTKDEFLATVSHELRTPLNAVLGWARMLRTRQLDQTTAERALETIERNAKSQAQLINDLLEVSRITSGKLRLNVQPLFLPTVVEAAVDSIKPAADAKQITVEMDIDKAVGPILGDPDRLQQVSWNLLSNAVKFTPRRGSISIAVTRNGSQAELNVADTGQGIGPDFLPYVFDRFRQADSSYTRTHAGLGLGLAIVRHLVEMHGGTVSVASQGEGRGTQFTVSLPILDVKVPAAEGIVVQSSSPGAAQTTATDSRLSGLRLLVVEDEMDAREMLKTMLEQNGAGVAAVSRVDQALTALSGSAFDMLLSDLEMPDADGYLLIRKIRSDETIKHLPAIAITGHVRQEDKAFALGAGFDAHVAKPVEMSELIEVIEKLSSGERRHSPKNAQRREPG